MTASNWAFLIIFVLAVALFGWSCVRRFGLIAVGRPEKRSGFTWKRIWGVVAHPFLQRCAISNVYRFGVNHAFLFWAFMLLLLANAEFLLHGIFPSLTYSRLPDGAYFTLAFIFDVVSLIALAAVVLAALRRLFFAPRYVNTRTRDAFTILGLIAMLMLAFFGLHGAQIGQGIERASGYMPISSFTATKVLTGIPASSLGTASDAFWWIHAVVLLGFLNYLPYSKHMHILTSIPNVYLRRLEGKASVSPREEFKKGNTYGVGRVDGFTWKGLLDSYACTECGRCSDSCPATATGKPLNPRLVVHDIKVNLLTNGPLIKQGKSPVLPLIGGGKEGSIEEEVIWECTTCHACVSVCPPFIEQFSRIIDMRRDLVQMRSKFPPELLNLFENMEGRSNPWGIAPAERPKWSGEYPVKPFEAGKTEYLFYVGCFGSFDSRARQVSIALAKILDAAGVSWGTLGKEEKCCGESLRRLGNEFAFERLTQENIKFYQDKGVSKVITLCPHCFTTLKNDYSEYGLKLEVYHHTEFIDRLIRDGRLSLNTADTGRTVFHDSCYLGRHNGIYTQPRHALETAMGKAPVEMERHGERGFCCGAGGGRMWMEEKVGKRINIERVEQALSKDPKTVAVCCPYCLTMFEDGLKDKGTAKLVSVLDVAEVVSKALK